MSSSLRSTADRTLPAWPVLLGIHVLVLAGLLAVGLRLHAAPKALSPPPPLEQQLQRLDLPAAGAALDRALLLAENPRVLTEGGEPRAEDSLRALADASGMELSGPSWGTPVEEAGIVRIPAALTLRGDPYDLPVLLEGLSRQPARPRLLRLEAISAAPNEASVRIELEYIRPRIHAPTWIGERLARGAPGVEQATPVLEQAAVLSTWRRFNAFEAERLDAIAAEHTALATQLPPVLIRFREEGGKLSWRTGEPVHLR